MIYSTFACRKGFWNQKAILYIRDSIKKLERKINKNDTIHNKKLYYLKIDISKYFYSINHSILEKVLLKNIEDKDLKYAVKVFINSYKTDDMFDDLFDKNSKYIQDKQKGIPIGSIISQLFANFYFNSFDHFVKRELKIKSYSRYMDDLLFIWEKEKLQLFFPKIIKFLDTELYLIINPKKISFNLVSDGISFVWYRIKNNKIYVWKRIIKWIQRFVVKFKELKTDDEFVLKRLENVWQSRRWFFDISDFWKSYINKLDFKL